MVTGCAKPRLAVPSRAANFYEYILIVHRKPIYGYTCINIIQNDFETPAEQRLYNIIINCTSSPLQQQQVHVFWDLFHSFVHSHTSLHHKTHCRTRLGGVSKMPRVNDFARYNIGDGSNTRYVYYCYSLYVYIILCRSEIKNTERGHLKTV